MIFFFTQYGADHLPYLKFGICIEHDVFDGTLDVFRPTGQPSHSVVMSHLLPVVARRRVGDAGISVRAKLRECRGVDRLGSLSSSTFHSLAAVDDDILRLYPFFQHSLFRVLTSTSEQTWRFNLEVADTFLMVVQQTVTILIHDFLICFFQGLP